MKKTWIKVKRGLLEPKHIEQLGQAWYLYFYILDNADWETGTIKEWKDKYAADELGKPLGMIREHRKLLEENYIESIKNRYSQTIVIRNWTNPRMYDGSILNEDTGKPELSDNAENEGKGQSLTQSEPKSKGQSLTQSFSNPSENLHSSYSHISHNTNHKSQGINNITTHQSFIQELVKTARVDFTNHKQVELLDDLVQEFGEKLILEIAGWCASKDTSSMGAILTTIKNKGTSWKTYKNNNQDGILAMFEEEIGKAVTNGK